MLFVNGSYLESVHFTSSRLRRVFLTSGRRIYLREEVNILKNVA
jgi:hypothetical protein